MKCTFLTGEEFYVELLQIAVETHSSSTKEHPVKDLIEIVSLIKQKGNDLRVV